MPLFQVNTHTVKKALARSSDASRCPIIRPPVVGTEQQGGQQGPTPSDTATRLLLLSEASAVLGGEHLQQGAQCAPLEELLRWLLSEAAPAPLMERQKKQAVAMAIMEALAGSAAFKEYSEGAYGCSLRDRWEVELKGSQHLYSPVLEDLLQAT
jgi:hypothetical protein